MLLEVQKKHGGAYSCVEGREIVNLEDENAFLKSKQVKNITFFKVVCCGTSLISLGESQHLLVQGSALPDHCVASPNNY